jgi:lipid II:glycine glycyltransferase (peptidoglycan interpeptide bridge formation enzyme)
MTYEYIKTDDGREISTHIFHLKGEDIAGAHYSFKRSHSNLISTADILSGFVFRDELNEKVLSFLLSHFLDWARKKKANYARIMPWMPKTIGGQEADFENMFEKAFLQLGFIPVLAGKHTYWLDLGLSEETLLAKMKSKTRYNIRLGAKSDILIEVLNKADQEIIEEFWRLYADLGEKKAFYILTESRFKNEVISLVESGLANLFVAKYHGQIINISLASNSGRASFMYGAMNPVFKNLKGCPSPGPIAHWEMIRTMKRKNNKIYDMGFTPGPVPYKGHPSFDMWRFKHGFGGDPVEFMPTYGKKLSPVRGRLFQYMKYKK